MSSGVSFGVNYVPRRGWLHAWANPDWSAWREDFQALADLGADHIRLLPLWPLLQPNRTVIDHQAIGTVCRAAELAGEAGLDVTVDALQGHLSSYDFLPSWVTSWHQRNLFTDPQVVAAQAELIGVLATNMRAVGNGLGITCGNEFGQFAAPRHPQAHPVNTHEASRWLQVLLEAARHNWPEGQHNHGYDDDLFFVNDHPFTPEHAARFGNQMTVHSWVFTRLPAEDPTDARLALFARYVLELANGYAAAYDNRRGLWLQEIGAPSSHLPAEVVADFVTATLAAVRTMPSLHAITWWCSHDVSRQLADFPDLEYTLGLLDTDNQPKPAGLAFANAVTTRPPASQPPRKRLTVEVAADGSDRAKTAPGGEVFDRWYQSARSGSVPALDISIQYAPSIDKE